jgi:hypothetical protein
MLMHIHNYILLYIINNKYKYINFINNNLLFNNKFIIS